MSSARSLLPSGIFTTISPAPSDNGGSLGDGCESTVLVHTPSSGPQQITIDLSFPAKAIIGQLCALSHIANPLQYDLVYYPSPESVPESLANSPEATPTRSASSLTVTSVSLGSSPVLSSRLSGHNSMRGRKEGEDSTLPRLWRRKQRSFVKTLGRELTEHSVLVLPEDVVRFVGDISLEEQGFIPKKHTLELIPKRRASYSSSSEQHSLDEEDGSSTLAYKECVEQFTSGAWPCNADRAAKICAFQICAKHGDVDVADVPKKTLRKWIRDGLPLEYRKEEAVYITASALFSTMAKSTSPQQARELYVQHCQKLDTYRATFFIVKMIAPQQHDAAPQILAISATSVVLLNAKTRQMLITMPLADIADMVATDTEFRLEFKNRLKLFAMTHQAHEIETTVTHHVKNARKQMRHGSTSKPAMSQDSDLPKPSVPLKTDASMILETQDSDLPLPLLVVSSEERQVTAKVAHHKGKRQTDGSVDNYVYLLAADDNNAFNSPAAAPNRFKDTLPSSPPSLNIPDKRPAPKPKNKLRCSGYPALPTRSLSQEYESLHTENEAISPHQPMSPTREISPKKKQGQAMTQPVTKVAASPRLSPGSARGVQSPAANGQDALPIRSDTVEESYSAPAVSVPSRPNLRPNPLQDVLPRTALGIEALPSTAMGDRDTFVLPTTDNLKLQKVSNTESDFANSTRGAAGNENCDEADQPYVLPWQQERQMASTTPLSHLHTLPGFPDDAVRSSGQDTAASLFGKEEGASELCCSNAEKSVTDACIPPASSSLMSSQLHDEYKQLRPLQAKIVPDSKVGYIPDERPAPKPRAKSGKTQSQENEMLSTAASSHHCSKGTHSVRPANNDQWEQINRQIDLMTTPKGSHKADKGSSRNSCPYTTLELNDNRSDNYQSLLSKGDCSSAALSTTSPLPEYESLHTESTAISSYQPMSPTREIPTKKPQGQVVTLPPPMPLKPSESSPRERPPEDHVQHVYNEPLFWRQPKPDGSPMPGDGSKDDDSSNCIESVLPASPRQVQIVDGNVFCSFEVDDVKSVQQGSITRSPTEQGSSPRMEISPQPVTKVSTSPRLSPSSAQRVQSPAINEQDALATPSDNSLYMTINISPNTVQESCSAPAVSAPSRPNLRPNPLQDVLPRTALGIEALPSTAMGDRDTFVLPTTDNLKLPKVSDKESDFAYVLPWQLQRQTASTTPLSHPHILPGIPDDDVRSSGQDTAASLFGKEQQDASELCCLNIEKSTTDTCAPPTSLSSSPLHDNYEQLRSLRAERDLYQSRSHTLPRPPSTVAKTRHCYTPIDIHSNSHDVYQPIAAQSTAPITIATGRAPTDRYTPLRRVGNPATPDKPATKHMPQERECRSTSDMKRVSSGQDYTMLGISYSKDVNCYQPLSSIAGHRQSHKLAGTSLPVRNNMDTMAEHKYEVSDDEDDSGSQDACVTTKVEHKYEVSDDEDSNGSQDERQEYIYLFGESVREDDDYDVVYMQDTSSPPRRVTHGVPSKPGDSSKDLGTSTPDHSLLAWPFTLSQTDNNVSPKYATIKDESHSGCGAIQPYTFTKIKSPPSQPPSVETSSAEVAPLRDTSLPKTGHGYAQHAILKVSKSYGGKGAVSSSSKSATVVKSQVSPQVLSEPRQGVITPPIGETVEDKASYDDNEDSNPYLIPMDYPNDKQGSVLSTGETCSASSVSSSSNILSTSTNNSRHQSPLSSCSSLTSNQRSQESSSGNLHPSAEPDGGVIAGIAATDSDVIPAYMTVDIQGTSGERKDALSAGLPLAISNSQVVIQEYRKCVEHFISGVWLCDVVTATSIAALQAYAEHGDKYVAQETSDKTLNRWVKPCLPSCYQKEKSALDTAKQHFKTLSEESNLSQAKQRYIHLCQQLVTYNSRSFHVRIAISQEQRLKPCILAVSSTSIVHLNENQETVKMWQLETLTNAACSSSVLQLTFSDGFCLSLRTNEGVIIKRLIMRNYEEHCLGIMSTSPSAKTMEDEDTYDAVEERNPYLTPVDYPDDEQCCALASGETGTTDRISPLLLKANTPTPTNNSRPHLPLSSCSSLTSNQKSRESSSGDAQASTKPGGNVITGITDTDSGVNPAYVTVGKQGTSMERKNTLGSGVPLAISKCGSEFVNQNYRRCTDLFTSGTWLCDVAKTSPIAALQAYVEHGDDYVAKKTSDKTIKGWVKDCLPSCYQKEKSALSTAMQHFKTLSEYFNRIQAKEQYIHHCQQLVTYNSRSFHVRIAISQEKRPKPCRLAVSSTSIIHLNENQETLKIWQIENLTEVTCSSSVLQLTFSDGFCLSVQTDEGDVIRALVVRNMPDEKGKTS